MTETKETQKLILRDTDFMSMMQRRIFNVLLVANPYDAFMLEDDGRIDEKVFEEYSNSTELFHHWEQFSESTVGIVKLYAPALELEKAVGKGTVSSHSIYAPFMNAKVGELEIGMEVTVIPDYFLNKAVMDMESLAIHTAEIGAMAFIKGA